MPAPLWETCEELLGDAGFLWTQRAERLHDPRYRIGDIESGPEARLKATIDALVLTGAPVIERILLPALQDDDPELLAAAALALLHPDRPTTVSEPVFERLGTAEGPALAALTRAIQLSPRADLADPLLDALSSSTGLARGAYLDIAAWWGDEPKAFLDRLTVGEPEAVTLAALRAARVFPGRAESSWLLETCREAPGPIRDAALESALLFDPLRAWSVLKEVIASPGPGWDQPALLWAIGCSDQELQPLIDALGTAERAPAAARALGFTGRRQAADALSEVLEDEALGPVAADAFASITGLELEDPFVLREKPARESSDDDMDDVNADDAPPLPRPDPAQVKRWWDQARAKLPAVARLLRGQPWSPDRVRAQLLDGPAHRRSVLALELMLRTHGALHVETAAWIGHQRRALGSSVREASHAPFSESRGHPPLPPSTPPCGTPWPATITIPSPPRGWSGALAVTALGMVSSLGDSAVESCAAGRAGLLRIAPLEDVPSWDEEGRAAVPLNGHCVAHHTCGFTGLGRMAALAVAALRDFCASAGPLDWGRTALHVALPSGRHRLDAEGYVEDLRARLPAAIRAHVPETAAASIRFGFGDACGFLDLLAEAQAALARHEIDTCIVGGVDSLVEPAVLEDLAARNQLKSPQQPAKPIPGEAAAFLLVERPPRGRTAQRPSQLFLGRPNVAGTGKANASRGALLAQVMATAIAPLAEVPGYMLSSLNGDDRRAYEWGTALVRAQVPRALAGAPASSAAQWFGELGAATGPVSLCMAARAHARGYSPANTGLLWLANDDGTRGALAVAGPEENR
jgi:uncharacterized protein (TIGR02270 family)